MHWGCGCDASRKPDHGSRGCGARQRRLPVGGAARQRVPERILKQVRLQLGISSGEYRALARLGAGSGSESREQDQLGDNHRRLAPRCSAGCFCKVAEFGKGIYRAGWQCGRCGKTFATGRRRWFCKPHQEDICFDCEPEPDARIDGSTQGSAGAGRGAATVLAPVQLIVDNQDAAMLASIGRKRAAIQAVFRECDQNHEGCLFETEFCRSLQALCAATWHF